VSQAERGGRPRGIVRQALAAWAEKQAAEMAPEGLTVAGLTALVPGMHPASRADRRMVHDTVMAMLRAGELVRVGTVPRSGPHGQPGAVYGVPQREVQAHEELASAITAWR
jgi:hypothetical protein